MSTTFRWTSTDLLALADDGQRREIIDGELYVSSQPHFYHQVVGSRYTTFLDLWNFETGSGFTAAAPGLIFGEDQDVAPDVVWASHDRLAAILRGGKLYGPPELVIEILSPGTKSTARDRVAKRGLYGRRGVDEYWITDWWQHRVEVYRRQDDQFTLVATLGPGDTLTSPLLPGFALPARPALRRHPGRRAGRRGVAPHGDAQARHDACSDLEVSSAPPGSGQSLRSALLQCWPAIRSP
jgi:Uma2 family endonuclease